MERKSRRRLYILINLILVSILYDVVIRGKRRTFSSLLKHTFTSRNLVSRASRACASDVHTSEVTAYKLDCTTAQKIHVVPLVTQI